ncbi:hypothetical protein ABEB36_002219 [Hypothenemus hampei]|uniref:Uncharacterized protein n=1 Tax=Hypothenemus hampei TaxID=57062 RepID=A0ABD1F4Y5_HYPHA
MKPNSSYKRLEYRKQSHIAIQGLTLDVFKKFNVQVEKVQKDVQITNFEMTEFEERDKNSVFGEKQSACYVMNFTTFNILFEVKMLIYEYECKSELLKLDIDCKTSSVEKEVQYCCNSLQRRRNLNHMFLTLITFASYLESRRLIINILLENGPNINIVNNKNGGKIIVYSDKRKNIQFGVFWDVACNSEHTVFDKIDIYFKSSELPDASDFSDLLKQLTEPRLQFNQKFHLWKHILQRLSESKNSKKSIIEDVSIIRHEPLILKAITTKKEFPNQVICIKKSESNLEMETLDPICVSDNDDFDQAGNNGNFPANDQIYMTLINNFNEEVRKKTRGVCSEITKLPCVDITSDSDVFLSLSHRDVVVTTHSKRTATSQCDNNFSRKKLKNSDDELQITGITYIIPD